jgi:hypothetical protein
MAIYEIAGMIYRVSFKRLEQLMRSVFGDVQSRESAYGYDLLYESGHIRLFFNTSDHDGQIWALDGEFGGSFSDMKALLSRIESALIDADIIFSVGYLELDRDRNEIGEEVQFYHPDFEERYQPPRKPD